MVLDARLSHRLGVSTHADCGRLAALLRRFGLPVAVPEGIQPDALLARMRLDKKNRAGVLRLILWRGIGDAEIAEGVPEAEVAATIASAPPA